VLVRPRVEASRGYFVTACIEVGGGGEVLAGKSVGLVDRAGLSWMVAPDELKLWLDRVDCGVEVQRTG
jgi:hypothetical protein